MAANKGSAKKGEVRNPNGRPKGSTDKRREFYDVVGLLQKEGFDPIQAFVKLAKDEFSAPDLRFKATKELADRISPQVKAVQHDHTVDVSEDLKQLAENMKEIMKGFVRDF
jgi:hypothetical protein